MAELGIDYFPIKRDILGIVKNNIKKIKVDDGVKINLTGDPYELFLDHKKSMIGAGNFVVGGTLSERTAERLRKIQTGEYNRDELLYNPVELYRLANELNYTINAEGLVVERIKAFKPLNYEMETLVKKGANLEEVKLDLLLDNFLSFNNIEENHVNAEFNEILVDNAIETYGTLCRYDRFSPYTRLYKFYKDYLYEDNPDIQTRKAMMLDKEIERYDSNMIRTYAFDSIMCEILKSIMQLRYATNRDSYLDKFSGVEMRKGEFAFLNSQPVNRRQFSEKFVQDIYNLATLKETVSLNHFMNLYLSLMNSLKKQYPEINVQDCLEEFSIMLTFLNILTKKTLIKENTPKNNKNQGTENENDL